MKRYLLRVVFTTEEDGIAPLDKADLRLRYHQDLSAGDIMLLMAQHGDKITFTGVEVED